MAAGNKIPLWAFGFLYWSLHLTHSLKEQALIQERTQCLPKGLRGPTTGGLNHLRNLSYHYLWQTNRNSAVNSSRNRAVVKTLKAGPARASSFLVPGAGMEKYRYNFQEENGCKTTSSTSSRALKNADCSSKCRGQGHINWPETCLDNPLLRYAYGVQVSQAPFLEQHLTHKERIWVL